MLKNINRLLHEYNKEIEKKNISVNQGKTSEIIKDNIKFIKHMMEVVLEGYSPKHTGQAIVMDYIKELYQQELVSVEIPIKYINDIREFLMHTKVWASLPRISYEDPFGSKIKFKNKDMPLIMTIYDDKDITIELILNENYMERKSNV